MSSLQYSFRSKMNIIWIKRICLDIFVSQHCKWVELLYCWGLEMVVQVVEWECAFEMNVVVVEVDGMDNIEFGMEDIEDVEGNMYHPIKEVGVDMDEKEE